MKNAIFSDSRLVEEFLDRYTDLLDQQQTINSNTAHQSRSADSPAIATTIDQARSAVKNVQAGRVGNLDPGLEAIVRRFGRPAYFVQNKTFDTKKATSASEVVNEAVNSAKANIDLAIPKVGRINLRNHRSPWVGTGWIVAENILVTNRHVALKFASWDDDGFVFIKTGNRVARAELDTVRERQTSAEIIYRLREVLWIAPPSGAHDVAFLSIESSSSNNDPQPMPIPLMTQTELDQLADESWVSIIGFPAFSRHNNAVDQQQIFEGEYDVKRIQPGKIMAKSDQGIINHDASTLGGNSGSVVLDHESGKAVALHFGGIEGDTNSSVTATVVSKLLELHAISALDLA